MGQKQTVKFDWDTEKDLRNQEKHGVAFTIAQYVFSDPRRIILEDMTHITTQEKRYYCVGKAGNGIMTVRFTCRDNCIRVYGAGFWRKGKRIYEENNKVY